MNFLKKHWKVAFFIAVLILPLGLILGPLGLKLWNSHQERKKNRINHDTEV